MTATFEFSDQPQILKVYNFTSDTHEFIGQSDAYIPEDTGLPADCTLNAPPEEVKSGHVLVWDGEKWNEVEDNRNSIAYDIHTGAAVPVNTLGPLEGLTPLVPKETDIWDGNKWVPDLERIRQAKITEIKQLRDRLMSDHVLIEGVPFNSDPSSRIQQITLTKMGQEGTVPDGFKWQNKNNEMVTLTNSMASKFEQETMQHDIRIFTTASNHISTLSDLNDIQSIIDYDISNGWVI